MQCGPIRQHTASNPIGAARDLVVVPHMRDARIDLPVTAGIQDVFRHLAHDAERTDVIATEVKRAHDAGRKVLVLTERTDHLDAIQAALRC